MEKIEFSQQINASARKVYETMLGLSDKNTYEQWTAEFNPTSTYKGSWDKGGTIYFIGTDEEGKRGGMIAEIAENIPHEFVSIRHYGILDGDEEITSGEQVEKWSGGFENYSFYETDGMTTVKVEMNTTEDFRDYFNQAWPKALNKLKDIIEK